MSTRASMPLCIVLIVSTVIVSAAIGAWVGVLSARDEDPLVGGAMIVMSALAGAMAGLVAGVIGAWKLPVPLARRAIWVLAPSALILLLAGLRMWWQLDQQTKDPEEAYAGLPVFVVVLERDPGNDPYLAPRVEINARTREWMSAMPDGRVCRGRLRAEVQRRVAAVLPDREVPSVCSDEPARGPLDRVSWQIEDGGSGTMLLTQACREAMPRAGLLARLVSMASGLADSKPSCD